MTRFRSAPLAFALGLALLASGCGDQTAAVVVDSIAAVQGSGERSAFEGQRARIEGVVTVLMADGAFVQSLQADADAATAEGLFVMLADGQPAFEVGQHVVAEGLVAESGDGATLTTLADARIDVRGSLPLPEPVLRRNDMRPTDAADRKATVTPPSVDRTAPRRHPASAPRPAHRRWRSAAAAHRAGGSPP